MILGAIAGYDPRDPFTSRRPVPDYTAPFRACLRGIRVGLIVNWTRMPACIRRSSRRSTTRLRCCGSREPRCTSLYPTVALAGAIFVGVADTEGAGARDDILRTRAAELDRARAHGSRPLPWCLPKYITAPSKARVLLRQQFLEALHQVDVLVSATRASSTTQAYGPYCGFRRR